MAVTRRTFLRQWGKGMGVAGMGYALGGCYPGKQNGTQQGLIWKSPSLPPFVDALPIPSMLDRPSSLVAHNAMHQLHRDLPAVPTYAYGGETYFGPTITANAYEAHDLHVINALGAHPLADAVDPTVRDVTNTDRTQPRFSHHLHGAASAPGDDGHPMDTFRAPEAKTYHYGHRQEAAHLWYHDHAMGITRLNVYAGLAGNYFLRDQWDTGRSDNPLGLPAGNYEIPLTLADRAVNTNGSLRIRLVTFIPEGSWEGGMLGDIATVNGKAWPVLNVDRAVYRFRIVNASNLATYRIGLSTGTPITVIGSDLGLLNASVATQRVQIAAGERADVLIDFRAFAPGTEIILTNDAAIPGQAEIWGAKPVPHIMKFRVGAAVGPAATIPTTLRGGAGRPPVLTPPGSPVRTRRITINQNWDSTRNAPAFMTLNNLDFMNPQIETPSQGSTEMWEFINTSLDDHPLHLHLARMRVVQRSSFAAAFYSLVHPIGFRNEKWNPDPTLFQTGFVTGPLATETGWKDTVWCPTGTITRVLVQFPSQAELGFNPDAVYTSMMGSSLQGYVFHCHVLDHEDNEMMLPYRAI